jgi:hypothetical protein
METLVGVGVGRVPGKLFGILMFGTDLVTLYANCNLTWRSSNFLNKKSIVAMSKGR